MRTFRTSFIVVLICIAHFSFAQKASKPNIILILADDLGYGDLGCYGQQKIATPNIDKLAQQGLKFNQFYAGSTVCAPSRASLLTGLHTGHTAVRGNRGMKPEGQFPLPESTVTIANLLQRQGYKTGAFGKWGLGFITTSGDPQKKGMDEFYGYNCQTLAHNYYPDHLWQNHDRIDFAENKTSNTVYSADVIHKEAMKFIDAQQQHSPFFLYLPYTLPHAEVIAPRDSTYHFYVKKFGEPPLQSKMTGDGGYDRAFEPYPHAAFAAMVTRLDRYVGDVVEAINNKGLAENTLILFSSDNGPHKEHGGDPDFFNSNGIYKGIKRDLYEGGIRVPLIAYWKGKIKQGTSDHVAAFWDLYPTFQELAGIPVSKNIDGISMLPVLMQKAQPVLHKYLYWELHESGGRQAVRFGEWKGVKLHVSGSSNSTLELYHLKTDPGEMENVAEKNPAIVQQIEAMMKEAHVSNPEWPFLYQELNKKQ